MTWGTKLGNSGCGWLSFRSLKASHIGLPIFVTHGNNIRLALEAQSKDIVEANGFRDTHIGHPTFF